MTRTSPTIAAIDLFCGAGGLSLGLQNAGIEVIAGIDLDPACEYPYSENIGAEFLLGDVADLSGSDLDDLWSGAEYRLLAGCAPCQAFSSHRRGADTSAERNWNLLREFGRLVQETLPEFVTMENVSRLVHLDIFSDFVVSLASAGYSVDYGILYGPDFGLPQERRRLVLIASRIGDVALPSGHVPKDKYVTVGKAIGRLRKLENGEQDPRDPLHRARKLSDINLKRMEASKPGGTWRDWDPELLAPCHKKASGASFGSFYGRMKKDQPSPTITTQSFNFGTGRFGHPEQIRSITLRESAILQGFPRWYAFVRPGDKVSMSTVGRLIGNAVPPPFGEAVAKQLLAHLSTFESTR